MNCATIIPLLLVLHQSFSQDKAGGAEVMCAGPGIPTSVQQVDTVINLKILLIQFADVQCRKGTDGFSPQYARRDYEEMLGSSGIYVSPAMHSPDGDEVFGSMNDYYRAMSGGRLRIVARVINCTDSVSGRPVWLTLRKTKKDCQQSSWVTFFSDAIQAGQDAGLDVRVAADIRIAIIYAGNMYFQQGGLNPRAGGICYVMSEVQGRPYDEENADARFSRVGIHCHEFAHTIGIGHSSGSRADLMEAGTRNGSVEGNAPAPFNAIVRARKGWANVIPIDSLSVQPLDVSYSLTNPTIFVMRNSNGDLFYIENRRFDQVMSIGAAVVPDYNNAAFFPPAWPHGTLSQGIFVWRVNSFDPYPQEDRGYVTEGLVYASGRYGRTYPENTPSETDDGIPFPGVSDTRILSPWSDSRNPYTKEPNYFDSTQSNYTLFVPNTKGGSTCGMEILSENREQGSFRVMFSISGPPNPWLTSLANPDSLGATDRQRTLVRQDFATLHQVVEVGGEIFCRRSIDNGASWQKSSMLTLGYGGNSAPCLTMSGSALLVVWQLQAVSNDNYGVQVRRSTDKGNSWSELTTLATVYRCSAPGPYPTVSGGKDSSALLVYRTDSSLVSCQSHDGGVSWTDPKSVVSGIVSSGPEAPKMFLLEQNYPNPFNPTTNIRYRISEFRHVRLAVYDLLGSEVALLVNERKPPGSYEVKFNGSRLASGVYFYRIQAGNIVQTKKLLLLR